MTSPQASSTEFGTVLRGWRARRKVSQLQLSLLSATSARNISFMEKSRSNPSREMIKKLADLFERHRQRLKLPWYKQALPPPS